MFLVLGLFKFVQHYVQQIDGLKWRRPELPTNAPDRY